MEVIKIKNSNPENQNYDKFRIEDRLYFVYKSNSGFFITDNMGRCLLETDQRPSKLDLLKAHKYLLQYQSNFDAQDHKNVLEDVFSDLQEIDVATKNATFKLNYSGINDFELFDELYNFQNSLGKLVSAFRKLNKNLIKEIKKS